MRKFWLNKLSTKQAVLGSIILLLALDLSQSLYHQSQKLTHLQKIYEKKDKTIKLEQEKIKAKSSEVINFEYSPMKEAKNPESGEASSVSYLPLLSDITPVLDGMYIFKSINYFLFGLTCKTCQGSWRTQYFPEHANNKDVSQGLFEGQSSEFPNVKTPETFANWLNQQPLEQKDVKLTFWGLGSCSDIANNSGLGFYGSAPSNSYVCKSGYVKIEDPIGTKKCYLAHVPWTGAYDTSFGTPAVQYGENQNGSHFWRYNLGQCKEVKGWFQ